MDKEDSIYRKVFRKARRGKKREHIPEPIAMPDEPGAEMTGDLIFMGEKTYKPERVRELLEPFIGHRVEVFEMREGYTQPLKHTGRLEEQTEYGVTNIVIGHAHLPWEIDTEIERGNYKKITLRMLD